MAEQKLERLTSKRRECQRQISGTGKVTRRENKQFFPPEMTAIRATWVHAQHATNEVMRRKAETKYSLNPEVREGLVASEVIDAFLARASAAFPYGAAQLFPALNHLGSSSVSTDVEE